jgi:hypothetical protein
LGTLPKGRRDGMRVNEVKHFEAGHKTLHFVQGDNVILISKVTYGLDDKLSDNKIYLHGLLPDQL